MEAGPRGDLLAGQQSFLAPFPKAFQMLGVLRKTLSEIGQSSNQISQIILVIDDIAFQPNLLAPNAGVEAARIGEAGRGFAIVTSEVRALAERSSDTAKKIKTLIGDSSKQVAHGVDLVGKAGEALQSIIGQITHISTLISGITEGAAEQSTAASHLLKSDVTKLTELVAHFEITG